MQLAKKRKSFSTNPARVITTGFAGMILIGSILLMLPISAKDGQFTQFIDALFTATSATCVTGLVVFDSYEKWSGFGQFVILALIQIGGLGIVTLTTFFNIAIGKKLGLRRLQIAQESTNASEMSDASKLIKLIIIITLSFEVIGAILLSTVFVPKYQGSGIFLSIFLAISAYCNAGFDLLGREGAFSSLVNYYDNPLVLYTIMGLIICGGLGFVVWRDLYLFRKTKKLILHTKIVLYFSGALILIGGIGFLILEWSNTKTLGNMTIIQKINNALFHSVSCRTAGFNTIDIDGLTGASKLFSIFLMFIGAAPGSTGGGIKITTIVVLIMTVVCVIRGKEDTEILGKTVSKSVVYKSMAVACMASAAVGIATSTIFFSDHAVADISGINALFESVSAFATVGLSTGVTGVSNALSRAILIFVMFLGRVGPVSLALSLALKNKQKKKTKIIPEGKIMVG